MPSDVGLRGSSGTAPTRIETPSFFHQVLAATGRCVDERRGAAPTSVQDSVAFQRVTERRVTGRAHWVKFSQEFVDARVPSASFGRAWPRGHESRRHETML